MMFARLPRTDRPDLVDARYRIPSRGRPPHGAGGDPVRLDGALTRLSHPMTIAVVVALVCVGVVVAMRLATNAAPVPLSRELMTIDANSPAAPPPSAEGAQRPPRAAAPEPRRATAAIGGSAGTPAEAAPLPRTALSGRPDRDRDAEWRQGEQRVSRWRQAERRQVEQRQAEQRVAERRDAEWRETQQRQAEQRDAKRRDVDPSGADARNSKGDDATQMRQEMAGAICAQYGIPAGYCRQAASRYGH